MMGNCKKPQGSELKRLRDKISESDKADRITLLGATGSEAKEIKGGYVTDDGVMFASEYLPESWGIEEIVYTVDGETNVGRVNGYEEYNPGSSAVSDPHTEIMVIKQ